MYVISALYTYINTYNGKTKYPYMMSKYFLYTSCTPRDIKRALANLFFMSKTETNEH